MASNNATEVTFRNLNALKKKLDALDERLRKLAGEMKNLKVLSKKKV